MRFQYWLIGLNSYKLHFELLQGTSSSHVVSQPVEDNGNNNSNGCNTASGNGGNNNGDNNCNGNNTSSLNANDGSNIGGNNNSGGCNTSTS